MFWKKVLWRKSVQKTLVNIHERYFWGSLLLKLHKSCSFSENQLLYKYFQRILTTVSTAYFYDHLRSVLHQKDGE